MSVSILPCTIDDADAMITCGEQAFANDVLIKAIFNPDTATREEIRLHHDYRTAVARKRLTGAGKYYFKAVDDTTGSLVGFVGMFDPQVDVDSQSQIDVERPKCLNDEFDAKFRKALREAEAKVIGDRKDVWYVQSMAVHPACQSRGIGKRLLRRAVREADKVGQDVILEASPAGMYLYRSCGFTLLERIVLDDEGKLEFMVMLRHPQKIAEQEEYLGQEELGNTS